eukprot:7379000-Prymnesium_polylepis.2
MCHAAHANHYRPLVLSPSHLTPLSVASRLEDGAPGQSDRASRPRRSHALLQVFIVSRAHVTPAPS